MTPHEFFEREMPMRFRQAMERLGAKLGEAEIAAGGGDAEAAAKAEKYRHRLGNARTADVAFQVEIAGEGGGTFTLAVRDGAMSARPGPAAAPLVALRQSVADWRATVEEGVGARFSLFGGPPSDDPEARGGTGFARFLAPSRIEQLRNVRVTVRFAIRGREAGPDWSLDIGIGGPPEAQPACTISVAHADYQEIAAGRLPPQAAYFAGKIRVEGDFGALLPLAPLLMGG